MRTEVISGAPSPASAGRTRTRPAAPASERVVRKRRRVWVFSMGNLPFVCRSRLKLAFELVEETPIRTVGDDLLGRCLDHTGLMHAKSIEADRVLCVVLPPIIV